MVCSVVICFMYAVLPLVNVVNDWILFGKKKKKVKKLELILCIFLGLV